MPASTRLQRTKPNNLAGEACRWKSEKAAQGAWEELALKSLRVCLLPWDTEMNQMCQQPKGRAAVSTVTG